MPEQLTSLAMSLSKSPVDASHPLSAEEMILLRTLQDRALRSKVAEMHSNLPMSHDRDGPAMPGPSDEAGSEWSEVVAVWPILPSVVWSQVCLL